MLRVLRQFGFDTYYRGQWNEESGDEYTLHVLANGDDEKLLELHAFLRGEDAEPGHQSSNHPSGRLAGKSVSVTHSQ